MAASPRLDLKVPPQRRGDALDRHVDLWLSVVPSERVKHVAAKVKTRTSLGDLAVGLRLVHLLARDGEMLTHRVSDGADIVRWDDVSERR